MSYHSNLDLMNGAPSLIDEIAAVRGERGEETEPDDRPCRNCGGTGLCQPGSIGYRFGMRRTCPACGGDGRRHAG